MLKNIIPRHPVKEIIRTIEFDRGDGSGFSFDADENCNPVFNSPEAKENYEYAIAHPEEFPSAFNEFTRRVQQYTENATGTCVCGAEVELWDQYQGACSCPGCGRWYNLYGQELLDPEYWEEDEYE